MDIEYYTKSISKAKKDFGKNLSFFVFARDLTWAKNNLPSGNKYIFITPKKVNDLFEFILMSNCKYFILANSTFSWWAAYLSESKKVIYKKQERLFFGGVKDKYFPSHWSEYSSK